MTSVCFEYERDIAFERIDLDDERFSLDYFDPETFHGSPRATAGAFSGGGLVDPPVLVSEQAAGRYRVGLGLERMHAMKDAATFLPSALVVRRGELEDARLLKELVRLKASREGFDPVERAMAVKKLFDLAGSVEDQILRLLGIGKNERLLSSLLSLAAASRYLKLLILQGRLHEHTAFEIFRFPPESWDPLARFLSGLFLGAKKRNEVARMMFDITMRDGSCVGDLMESVEPRSFETLRVDPPRGGEMVYEHFVKLRYPELWTYREKFLSKLKEVGFGDKFRIGLPENFEKWEFTVQFRFGSAKDYRASLKALERAGSRKAFFELMELRA